MTSPSQDISPPRFQSEVALEAWESGIAGRIAAGAAHAQVMLAKVDCSGLRAADMCFEEAVFANATLSKTVWQNLRLTDARLDVCDLSNADWRHSWLTRCAFQSCRLTGADLSESQFHHVTFEKCKINLAQFQNAKFTACAFRNCDLEESDLGKAAARGVLFMDCKLRGTRFYGADLHGADLRGSDVASLGAEAMDLRGAIVSPEQLIWLASLLGLEVK